MRRLLSLPARVLFAALLTGCALAHAASEDTFTAPIGRALVVLPVPPGFVEPSRSVPPLRALGERMTPASNRLLAVFITQEDEAAARAGQRPEMARYYMAQTLRQTEDATLGAADFGQVRGLLRQQYQSLLRSVTGAAQSHLDNVVRESGQDTLSMKIGELKGLDVFDERDTSISLLAMTKVALQQGNESVEVPLAMSITTARVKDKLVYFYAYSLMRGPADLDWLRSTTRDWLPRLAAAN